MDSRETRQRDVEEVEGLRPQMREGDRFSIASMVMNRLHRYKILLRKFWWVMLLGILLGVGPAFVLVSTMPPKWSSESRMVMAQRMTMKEGVVSDEIQNFMGTQSEMLKSSRVQERAMEKILEAHPEMKVAWAQALEINPKKIMFDFTSRDSLRNQALTLTATGEDPQLVREFLNEVMSAYLAYKKELREQTSESTYDSLNDQVNTLEKEIQALRNGISDFRATNNVVMLEQVGAGRAQELGTINNELNSCKRELDTLNQMTPEQIQAAVARTSVAAGGDTVSTGIGSDMASALSRPQTEYYKSLQDLEKLKSNREALSEFLRDSHPKIRDIDEEIAGLQRVVDSFLKMAQDIVKAQREALEVKVKNLEAAFADMQERASAADKMLVEYTNMQDELKLKQDKFLKVMDLVGSVDFSKITSNESLSIMDAASPAKSVAHRLLKLLLGFMAGVFFGFVALYIIDLFDDTFGTISELREQIQENVLGQIPDIKDRKDDEELLLLSEENENSHALMESFRNLRSSIIFSYAEKDIPCVICVTSSVPSEGKSTVSSNLAVSLAMGLCEAEKEGMNEFESDKGDVVDTRKRVLLVDGDIRRGKLYKKFKVDATPGLVEYLQQRVPLKDVIRRTDVPSLDILPAGTLQKSPGELFLSPALDAFIKQMRKVYKFIVIDSAPMLATDDTSNLAQKADGAIFVVRGGYTSIRYTRESLKRLRSRRIQIMGLVFNRGYASRSDSYYYYYDYYEYYGGKDGTKKKRRKKRKSSYYYGHHSHGEESEGEESPTAATTPPATAESSDSDDNDKA